MKIKTSQALKDLAGKDLKGSDGKAIALGPIISNILLTAKTGGKMKLYELAKNFYAEKDIDLDTTDLNMIKEAVEQTGEYNNLVTGQILIVLANLKDK